MCTRTQPLKLLAIIMVGMVIVCFGWPASAQTPADPTAGKPPESTEAPAEKSARPPEIGKIDAAGNRISKEIEVFSKKTPDRVGRWIDSKVFFQSLEYLLDFEDRDNCKIVSVTGVNSALTRVLAIKVDYEVSYQNRPVLETVEKTDTTLSAAPVLNC